ncbi:Cysteine desulfuration protein SufE [Candidatus Providencia siddallii]|uniref:Cysteine desulfuration protein SufE n=1 Tax=Candidatus Providencia siddallii TaxID=1715285 RepID=A0A0M6W8V0_9GAMM|nr:Cysteine desulfuration protein SufE [Candidatus Providencia siddallii]
MQELPDKNTLLLNFSCCQNWEDKYLYIIELGYCLPKLNKTQKNNKNIILGCQSNVWIYMEKQLDETIFFTGDSDALIVKGLVAIVIILFQGKTVKQIISQDIQCYFKQLSLEKHLTPSRSQGLSAILHNILTRINTLI